MPERFPDRNGNYVDYTISESSGVIVVNSLQTPFAFGKNDCSLNMYSKGLFSEGINLVSSTFWKIKEADFREGARGNWTNATANFATCVTNTNIDSQGTLRINAVSQDSNGIITRELVKETDKPLKINVKFKQLDPTKLTKKYGLEEVTLYSSEIDRMDINGVDIDKSSLNSRMEFDRNNIDFKEISIGKLTYDFTQGFEQFSHVDIERTNNQIIQTLRYFESDILLEGREFVVDPTFGYTASTIRDVRTSSTTGSSCGTPNTFNDSGDSIRLHDADLNGSCRLPTFNWDTSSIDDSATITDVLLNIEFANSASSVDCEINPLTNDPFGGASASTIWTDANDGTPYVGSLDNCDTGTDETDLDLGSSADTDLEGLLGADWFSIALVWEDMSRVSGSTLIHNTGLVELEVTYTTGGETQNETDETGLEDSLKKSITKNITDSLGAEDSVSTMTGATVNITDQLGLDDSLSTMAANTINITDELGAQDSITKNPIKNLTEETALEDDDLTTMTGANVNITDQLGLEDSVATASSILNLTDQLGLEDEALESDVDRQQYNAIRIYLNVPASDRLGGVFALTCPAGEYVRGIDTGGNLICEALPP